MDVAIDRDRCEGTGFCVRLAPEHFALDEQGISQFHTGDCELDADLMEEAEALCPTNAIRLDRSMP